MKPYTIEDHYVWQYEEMLRLKRMAEERLAREASKKRRMKKLHWMHCPKCGQALTPQKLGSVEIDVCPNCKGLWLDTNELETVLAEKNPLLSMFLSLLAGDAGGEPDLVHRNGIKVGFRPESSA